MFRHHIKSNRPDRMNRRKKTHLDLLSPVDFGLKIAKSVISELALKDSSEVSESTWAKIFADSVEADYQPWNFGLGDFVSTNAAWNVKTVWVGNPVSHQTVNLPFGKIYPQALLSLYHNDIDPQLIGEQVLQIWNERVNAVRARFADLRTVVLLKSRDLTRLAIFEFETTFYPPEQYFWQENEEGNLEGLERTTRFHKFTWQPHGSQFTIIEPVPEDCLLITLKQPPKLEKDEVLKAIRFDESWISVRRKNQESA